MDTLVIMLCNNNPDNGVDTGYISSIAFGDYLSCHAYYNAMTCRRESIGIDRIRLGRKRFRIISYQTWVGNWCWDAVRVDIETANAIAEHIRASRKFNPEMGVSEIWDAWDTWRPIDFGQVKP